MVLSLGNSWSAEGKHCYVTGGSQGLGLAVAIRLAESGAASVAIVARNLERLRDATQEIERHRKVETQQFRYHSYPLNSSSGSHDALDAECQELAKESKGSVTAPDVFFLCAGSARPSFWIENTEDQLVQGMEQAYWVQAWTAHAAMKKLVHEKRTAKIVFVGSTASMMSFVGFAPYAPGKHALKGLAESLRSEGLLYGIDVHIFFAPTMDSPGLVEENKLKPAITTSIEAGDEVLSCEAAAACLLRGVEKNRHHITATLIGSFFSNSNRGATPISRPFLGPLYDLIAWIGIPLWRRDVDSRILKIRQDHQDYLGKAGFFSISSLEPLNPDQQSKSLSHSSSPPL